MLLNENGKRGLMASVCVGANVGVNRPCRFFFDVRISLKGSSSLNVED